MQTNTKCFVPVFSSKAGMCLTLENWEELGIEVASFYLDVLLVKPGLSLLHNGISLKKYWGWKGKSVLNATRLFTNKEGFYIIRSPFDGSIVSINEGQLASLIVSLAPDFVVLPSSHSLQIPQSIRILSPGDYFIAKTGEEMSRSNAHFIEADCPANDAIEGKIITQEGITNLLDHSMAKQYEKLDESCQCPTCTQHLTKAYLHHLLLQTPLLCQRFLIHHNVHFYKQLIAAS